jgi:phosphatidylserine decarboxylase
MPFRLPVYCPPGQPAELDPIVNMLQQYLIDTGRSNALEESVKKANSYGIPQLKDWGITSADGFLNYANDLLKWIPHENHQGKDIYWTLSVFYFILDLDPLLPLQTKIIPTSIGKPLTWLSSWIVCYAQRIGEFMDTPGSITTGSFESFINSPAYHMDECIVPEGGFKTFNELFARHLKAGMRPISNPNDPRTVVFPADCSFDGAWQIQPDSIVTIKTLPWPIKALLKQSNYHGEFEDGIWMHAFLNTFDYHRQHAPVAGKVVEAKVIQGAAYLEVVVQPDENGVPTLAPIRGHKNKAPKKGFYSSVSAPDSPGYQFLQMRGLITIDSPVLGLVAVLPIGMAQVSSVKLSVKAGDTVKKGQEISYFQFGGSDVVLVFQKKSGLGINSFPNVTDPPTHYNMGNTLAIAPST